MAPPRILFRIVGEPHSPFSLSGFQVPQSLPMQLLTIGAGGLGATLATYVRKRMYYSPTPLSFFGF